MSINIEIGKFRDEINTNTVLYHSNNDNNNNTNTNELLLTTSECFSLDQSRAKNELDNLSIITDNNSSDLIQTSGSTIESVNLRSKAILLWKDLTIKVKIQNRYINIPCYNNPSESIENKEKVLLNSISGIITGGLVSIIGPSGSGKSTLLNSLSYRLDKNTILTGNLYLNGLKYNQSKLKLLSGYVMQDDLLNPNLTVWETINYTAELRLSINLNKLEKENRCRLVLSEVGLLHCLNVIVGSPDNKGISGGERKRLCIALELLIEPLLLFADEPTSGLDSTTALSLMKLFYRLSRNKIRPCTVICSIHQPQYLIFQLFDSIILMKKGNILYQGSSIIAIEKFEKFGFPCHRLNNPADHIMNIISDNNSNNKLLLKINNNNINGDNELDRILIEEQKKLGLNIEIDNNNNNDKLINSNNLIISSIIPIPWIYQTSFIKRTPALFFVCINSGMFGALQLINSFPAERLLTLRERASGSYKISSYFISKQLIETLFTIINPIIFSPTVYYLIGFQNDTGKFFIFMGFMILCTLAATSIALAISTICRTVTLSVTILPFILELMRLFGSFFLSPKITPQYFIWLDSLSYVKYTYIGISLNELNGLILECKSSELKNGICPITNGQYSIDLLGLDYMPINTITGCALVLVAYIILFRFIAYLGLRFIK